MIKTSKLHSLFKIYVPADARCIAYFAAMAKLIKS